MLTASTRLGAAICLVAVGAAAAMLARPARYEVEGVSMAPGLLPGDIVTTSWFPKLVDARAPRRFQRWILTAPDGAAAIKRVVGLPGEVVSIRDGDLAVGGRMVVKPPVILAEVASIVVGHGLEPEDEPSGSRRCRYVVAPAIVLDDAGFAPTERRLLLPVRDVGIAATICCHFRTTEPPRLRVQVGALVIAWRLPSAGSFAVVAGRLDGHLVAVCWRCDASLPQTTSARLRLPPVIPEVWQLERPWPAGTAPGGPPADDDTTTPGFAVWIEGDGLADGGCDPSVGYIERAVVWRDVLHRPAADGRDEWRLGTDDFFVLGDFPSGSRDSRQWGPLRRGWLRSPVSAALERIRE